MPGNEFRAEVTKHDEAAVLHLQGDVNRDAENGLQAAYDQADGGALVLDFRNVDYINSTGIALIVGLLAKARATGRPVRAFGLTDHYREIFEITRISDFITLYQDEESALSKL